MEIMICYAIVMIFIPVGAVSLLYMIYIVSKAWHKRSLELRKEIAAFAVELSAQPGIERELIMINVCPFIAIIALGLSWVCFTSNVVILCIGNLIFIAALLAEIYMSADIIKKIRKQFTSTSYIHNAKRAKLVWRLYVSSRVSFIVGFTAGTFFIYSVYGW